MRKLFATTAIILALSTGGLALAHEGGGHGQEMLSQFSPKTQELIKSSWKSGHEENKADHEQIKTLHNELNAILTAPTFDKAAFLAKHKQIDAIHQKMEDARIAHQADLFAQLSQKERQQFADNMAKSFHHRGDKGNDQSEAVPPAQ